MEHEAPPRRQWPTARNQRLYMRRRKASTSRRRPWSAVRERAVDDDTKAMTADDEQWHPASQSKAP